MKRQTSTDEPTHVVGPDEWHAWLERNHEQKSGVWLVIQKKGADGPGIEYEEAVDKAVCFGWIDGKMHSVDEKTYVLRFTRRRQGSIWSRSNRERAERSMREGRMSPAGLAEVEKARANGRWDGAYTSREKPAVPPDLGEALKHDPAAWANFTTFSNSHQTAYIQWVLGAKRRETRQRRIAEVVSRSLRNKRPGA